MKANAKKLIEHYRQIHTLITKAESLAYCYNIERRTGCTYTEDERKKLQEAELLLSQATDKFNQVYEAKIGRAVGSAVRRGDWK